MTSMTKLKQRKGHRQLWPVFYNLWSIYYAKEKLIDGAFIIRRMFIVIA